MPEAQVSILGGLPVIADVWFTRGDGWEIDDDSGVNALHWQKSNGTKGREVGQKIYDKLNKTSAYWECLVVEQAREVLACEAYEARHGTHNCVIQLVLD